ncbi:MAG TPA: HAD-IA family hydrolase [Jiangellaceae bacterium]|nr:HAD-IA family hydrolase [Jiangellaceae bacterium]
MEAHHDRPNGLSPRGASVSADALLFDLDGTLVDSTPAVVRSWLTWAREYDIDPARLVGAHGRTSESIIAELLGPAATDEHVHTATARIDQLELADLDGVQALPGASDLLSAIPPSRWTIVTSGRSVLARARLAAAGIPEPEHLVTADEITRGKPDPQPYLLGAKAIGVEPSDCVVLEDAANGVTAAKAAGMRVVALTTTEPEGDPRADLVVPDLSVLSLSGGTRLTLTVV